MRQMMLLAGERLTHVKESLRGEGNAPAYSLLYIWYPHPHHTYTCIYILNIFEKSLLRSPGLHLFNKNIVEQ